MAILLDAANKPQSRPATLTVELQLLLTKAVCSGRDDEASISMILLSSDEDRLLHGAISKQSAKGESSSKDRASWASAIPCV